MTVDPNTSPYKPPATEGLPYAKDSEEAKAIRRILERANAEPRAWERVRAWLRK